MKKRMKNIAGAALAILMAAFTAVPAMAEEYAGNRSGGHFTDSSTLTWKADNGTTTTYGRGSVFSDVHPEITDPEYYLKESVRYPGEEIGAVNSKGEVKGDYTDAEEEELKKFLHSFDWIHSDELTRVTEVYNRIANGYHGNEYGRAGRTYSYFPLLMEGKGICENFANEYARLAQFVGLECEAYNCELTHKACLLKISGQWFHVDPTYGSGFFTANDTFPVDYETEKGRYDRLVDEKWDTYYAENPDHPLKDDYEMMKRLWSGEITVEEYNAWALSDDNQN